MHDQPSYSVDCLLAEESPGVWRCAVCQRPYRGPRPPRRQCRPGEAPTQAVRQAAEKLGISIDDLGHYAAALARWAAAGFPVRSQAEVARIEVICRACEHYVEGRCRHCGCRVNTGRIAITNKIKMASERCAVGRW